MNAHTPRLQSTSPVGALLPLQVWPGASATSAEAGATVTTPAENYSFACLFEVPPSGIAATDWLIEISAEVIEGHVGIGAARHGLESLIQGYFSPTNGIKVIRLLVSDIKTISGVLVRNGDAKGCSSKAVIHEICLRPLERRAVTVSDVVEDFETLHSSAMGADVSVVGNLEVFGSKQCVHLIRLGQGILRSTDALRSLADLAITSELGFAVTPQFKNFTAILAVRGDRAQTLRGSTDQWMAELCDGSVETYKAAVRQSYGRHASILDEAMRREYSDEHAAAPSSLIFEAANICNLACPMCPRIDRDIPDGLMSLEQAKSVIDSVAKLDGEFIFYPHYLGETLIHPNILGIIDHVLAYKNIRINLISNAVLLDERKQVELLNRRISIFSFSIHESDTAFQIGVHPRLAVSTRNVLKFLSRMTEQGRRQEIRVEVSMATDNLRSAAVEEFRQFWVGVVDAVLVFSGVAKDRSIPDKEAMESLRDHRFVCTAPWEAPVVAFDGTVLPCCWDYNHSMPMGNAFEAGFDEIWNGEAFKSLRRALLSKDLTQYPTCRFCDKWANWVPAPPVAEMADFHFVSNGTFHSYTSKSISDALLTERLSELPDKPDRRHLPLHYARRRQAKAPSTA